MFVLVVGVAPCACIWLCGHSVCLVAKAAIPTAAWSEMKKRGRCRCGASSPLCQSDLRLQDSKWSNSGGMKDK